MNSMKIQLNDGTEMPQLTLGVFRVPSTEVERVVAEALELGYRSFDTATSYENEKGVGRAINKSGIPREEIYLITKLSNTDHNKNMAPQAIEKSLEELELNYIDLYLMHWPMAASGLFVDIWRQFETFKSKGLTKSIGASNYRIVDLERILNETDTPPAVNQIELHPLFRQKALQEYASKHGIITQCWGPFGFTKYEMFNEKVIQEISKANNATPAQVLLRWYYQHGWPVAGKTSNPEHMLSNLNFYNIQLSDADMEKIDAMNLDQRIGPDPDLVDG